uniref:Very-long-chain 3-oxoacyl-CoA synthase n=1 Tax=Glossina brevipalpis TaxID=37001 RepID=A0A1A9WG66_9MUSC
MRKFQEVPYKPSLLLQVLMFCNVYFSAAWVGVYGFYILYNLFNFNDLHGNFVIMAYLFSAIVEYYRLYLGYKGNLKCRKRTTNVGREQMRIQCEQLGQSRN